MAISNNLHTSITQNTIADGDNLQSNVISELTQNDVDVNTNIDNSEKKVDAAAPIVRANSANNWANSAITGFSAFTFKDDTTNKTFIGASKAAKNFTIAAAGPVTINKQNGKYAFDINVADPDNKSFSSYLRRAGYSRNDYSPSLSFIMSNVFGVTWPYSFANTLQAQNIDGVYFGQRVDNITAVSDPAAANTECRTGYNPDDGSEITGYANTDVENGSFVYQTEYYFTRKYSADNCSIGLFQDFTAVDHSVAVKGAVAKTYSLAFADRNTYTLNSKCASASRYSTVLICNSTADNYSECIASDNSHAFKCSTCYANNDSTGLNCYADNYSFNAVNNDNNCVISALSASYAACYSTEGYVLANNNSVAIGVGSNQNANSQILIYSVAIGAGSVNTTASNCSFAVSIKGGTGETIATNSAFTIIGGGVQNLNVTANDWSIALLPTDKASLLAPSSFCHGTQAFDHDIRLTDNVALSHNNSYTFLTTLNNQNNYAIPSVTFITTAKDIQNSIAIKCCQNTVSNSDYKHSIALYNDTETKMTSGIALFNGSANASFAAYHSTAANVQSYTSANAALYYSYSDAGLAMFDSTASKTVNSTKKAIALFGSTANNNDKLFSMFENTFDIDTLPDITCARATSFDVPIAEKRVYFLQDLS